MGEPIASAWLAATVEDDLVTFSDLFEALADAGVAEKMVNPRWEGDLTQLEGDLPAVTAAVESYLQSLMEDQLAAVHERLEDTRQRLERWQVQARLIAEDLDSEPKRRKRLGDIDRVKNQIDGLIVNQTPADAPLIRVVAALVPRS